MNVSNLWVTLAGSMITLSFNETGDKPLCLQGDGGAIRCNLPALEIDGGRQPPAGWTETRDGDTRRITLAFERSAVDWVLNVSADSGRITVRSRLVNRGKESVALGKAFLIASGSATVGTGIDDLVMLPLSGDLTPRRVYRVADPDGPRTSKIKTQFWNARERVAMQIGFLSFRRADTVVASSVDSEQTALSVSAWCDFGGWALAPGAETDVETFSVAIGNDPHAQLEDWADRAAALCKPRRWDDAPIGWLGWAWVDPYTVERYQDVVLRNSAAIRDRLAGFDIRYIWVSIGNIEDGYPGNWLKWNAELFPDGPAFLVRRLAEQGFTLGLWCSPFWVCTALKDLVAQLMPALLKHPDGTPMRVLEQWRIGRAGTFPPAERPGCYGLDPSHPDTHAFLHTVFSAYRQWGVRYYMLDFLEAGAGNLSRCPYPDHVDKSIVPGPEAYHAALDVVRRAAGEDTYLLSSTGPSIHNAGVMDAVRTGNDFGEGRPLNPEAHFYPGTFVINDAGFWTGPQRALQNQAAAYYTHRKLYLNDSGNVLTVDKPIPEATARLHATIHAMSGGPTMLGDDIERIAPDRLEIIKKTLPRSREVAFPVDLFSSPAPDSPTVFHRRIDKTWGRFDVVALYNMGDTTVRRTLDVTRLGLEADRDYLVWDFWNCAYLGGIRGALDVEIPPSSVRVLRLVADPAVPVLVGTDMHVLMGEVEVDACTWDPATLTLAGAAARPAGETGNLFVRAPAGLCAADPAGRWLAKDARDGSLIVRLALRFTHPRAAWSVRFAPIGGAGSWKTN